MLSFTEVCYWLLSLLVVEGLTAHILALEHPLRLFVVLLFFLAIRVLAVVHKRLEQCH